MARSVSTSHQVTTYAPATVGNVGCGFDVLGLALPEPGDRVTVRAIEGSEVVLAEVTGDGGRLPREAEANTASVAARALLEAAGVGRGVEIFLEKGLPLSSGLGSSGASAVAAVVAVDALFGLASSKEALLAAALEGEEAVSGGRPADNAAACLWGGIVLVRPALEVGEVPEVIPLPVPEGLAVAVAHPQMEVPTREARVALPRALPLSTAVAQQGHLAAFVAALYRNDLDLLGRSLVDLVAEPARAPLVPGFAAVKEAALAAGALGMSLSGAGPSTFALCRGLDAARRVAEAMAKSFEHETGQPAEPFASHIAHQGARVIKPPDVRRGSG